MFYVHSSRFEVETPTATTNLDSQVRGSKLTPLQQRHISMFKFDVRGLRLEIRSEAYRLLLGVLAREPLRWLKVRRLPLWVRCEDIA
jgi:hypothetical protein